MKKDTNVGEFEVKVADIIVKDRFRTDFGNITDLASSIEKHGLIHAITLDENYNLIAGERRFRAHQNLGKATVRCRIVSGLSEIQKKEIEIEENLQRKSFTWQEEVAGKEAIHILKQAIYGNAIKGHKTKGWSLTDTALALGESMGTVSMDIQLAEGLRLYPQLKKETKKTVAYKKYKQLVERDLRRKLSEIEAGDPTPVSDILLCGDCISLMKTIKDETVDLVVTDPPYGIDLDKSESFSNRVDVYSDIPHEVDNMIDLVVRDLYRIMRPQSHIYMFFPITKFEWLKSKMKAVGFTTCDYPLIWDKGTFSYASQGAFPALSYETIIFAKKGNRPLEHPIICTFPVTKLGHSFKIHPVERPLQLLRTFIEASSKEGELVFDPFAGSASTLIAALELGRKALGIEKDIPYHQKASERINNLITKGKYTTGTHKSEILE